MGRLLRSYYIWKVFREEAVDFTHPFLNIGLGVLGYRGAAPRSLQQLADDDSLKVSVCYNVYKPN